jgi:hypothetical protein
MGLFEPLINQEVNMYVNVLREVQLEDQDGIMLMSFDKALELLQNLKGVPTEYINRAV